MRWMWPSKRWSSCVERWFSSSRNQQSEGLWSAAGPSWEMQKSTVKHGLRPLLGRTGAVYQAGRRPRFFDLKR